MSFRDKTLYEMKLVGYELKLLCEKLGNVYICHTLGIYSVQFGHRVYKFSCLVSVIDRIVRQEIKNKIIVNIRDNKILMDSVNRWAVLRGLKGV